MASLSDVDLSLRLESHEGSERLERAQKRLLELRLRCGGLIGDGTLGPGLLVLFEGWDASGKGGAIRRLTASLDPRHFHVAEFAAPSEREKRHHFLWRFWPHVPGLGGMSVFDRTYYGRVLVERVDGLASEAEWQRAYREIVEFERSLTVEGVVIVKFWMHISADEQLSRFNARAADPLKAWKLTEADWRNREKRPAYEAAVADMLERTDHEPAPWTVIAAESKSYARVAVIETVIYALERGLRSAGQEPLDVGAAR